MKTAFKIVCSVLGLALVGLLLAGFFFMAYRDWSFICENTGSRKGHREWFFGARTQQWQSQSSVEGFAATQYAGQFTNRWTSYAGTGRNIYGMSLLHGHGRPGAILHIRIEELNKWFDRLPEAKKKEFYELLLSKDQKAISTKIDEILEQKFMQYPSQ